MKTGKEWLVEPVEELLWCCDPLETQLQEVMTPSKPQSLTANETGVRKQKISLHTRRSFLKTSAVLVGGAPLWVGMVDAQSRGKKSLLMAYVGTFSSPLRDVLPTQVDLPPGNGRGIHIFQVDRSTGVLTPSGVYEMGTSPSCLAVNAAGLACILPMRRIGSAKAKKGRSVHSRLTGLTVS